MWFLVMCEILIILGEFHSSVSFMFGIVSLYINDITHGIIFAAPGFQILYSGKVWWGKCLANLLFSNIW